MTDAETKEKIARSVGFEKRQSLIVGAKSVWFYPDGTISEDLPDFPNNFDACLKWIAPNLIRWQVGTSNGKYKYYALIAGSDDGPYPFPFDGSANIFARAFCLSYINYLEFKERHETKMDAG